jgi:flavodoxin
VNAGRQPKILFVYYTLSRQTGRVVDAMAAAATARGCGVTTALIDFTDEKWTRHLTGVPMKHPMPQISSILVAQRRRQTGEIKIPPEAQQADHDLVVFGSPTWWLTTNMPIRSYLKSPAAKKILEGKPFAVASVSRRYYNGNIKDVRKLGEENGGRFVGATHFVVAGGQVKSMLSWLGYMKHGEAQERVFGLKMPPPNLKPDYAEQARQFIDELTDRVLAPRAAAVGA